MLRPSIVFKLFLYLFVLWLILTLVFLAFPSPERNDDGTNYPTSVLRSGKPLTRVYETNEFYHRTYGEDYQSTIRAHEPNKVWLVLDYQLDVAHKHLLISGQKEIPLVPTEPHEDVSSAFVVNGRAGNVDDLLGLHPPWFQEADAVLLAWQVQRDGVYLTLRTRWVGEKLELWPDARSWLTNDTNQKPEPPKGWQGLEIEPFLTIHAANGKFKSASVPHPPLSRSPTSTYTARASILAIIAPTAWLVYVVFCLLGMAIGAFSSVVLVLAFVIIMIMYAWWISMDRPSYKVYVARLREKCDECVVKFWEKYDEFLLHIRPLGPRRRRAASATEETNTEKAQEEGNAFPV